MSPKNIRPRFRAATAVTSFAAIAALFLSGCAGGSGGAAAGGGGESAAQQQNFAAFYEQSIEWQSCDEGFGLEDAQRERLEERGGSPAAFQCAKVEAPLDWNDAENGDTIELAVTHLASAGEDRQGVLFGNPGGPGASGLDYTYNMSVAPGFDEIMQSYDLIGFDPRGIGSSTPIECEAESPILTVQIAACAEQAPLARTMGTSQVARDMELLRQLMGDEKMHYLGYSYGTMLGATYSTLFPERVGRMLLDSAEGAGWATLIGSLAQTQAIEVAIEDLFAECGTRYDVEVCPFADITALMEAMGDLTVEPLLASDGTEVNGRMLYQYLLTSLYQRTVGREIALDTTALALSGNQDAIDRMADAMSGGGATVGLAGSIVRCHSFPEDPDVMGLLAYAEETGVPALLGGPELSPFVTQSLIDLNCFALAESGDDITDSFSGSPDAPILIIGITGDHATHYEGAVQLTEELGNARLLTLDGAGHAASYTGRSSCIDQASTAYLLRGELPPEGAVCTDD